MKLTVRVTKEHIDNGVRGKCRHCPIALALNEQHPQADGDTWAVGSRIVLGTEDVNKRNFPMPNVAWFFIRNFDSGKPVRPFTFEFEMVEEVELTDE